MRAETHAIQDQLAAGELETMQMQFAQCLVIAVPCSDQGLAPEVRPILPARTQVANLIFVKSAL